jgi:hypothetical protein
MPCQDQCQIRVGGTDSFDFAKCPANLDALIKEQTKKCHDANEGEGFVLKSATDGEGECMTNPNVFSADLSSGALTKKISVKASNHSVWEADVALSCPVSLNSTLTPASMRAAKPYATCITKTQKICSGFDVSPSCIVTQKTSCVEVCIRASFCDKKDAQPGKKLLRKHGCRVQPGEVKQRKHGWRSPGGTACCYKDCKLPPTWYGQDGAPLEPASWCHQTMAQKNIT